jgi:hypothetical protein
MGLNSGRDGLLIACVSQRYVVGWHSNFNVLITQTVE